MLTEKNLKISFISGIILILLYFIFQSGNVGDNTLSISDINVI